MTLSTMNTLAQRLYDEAFSPSKTRTPRSDAYKLGVKQGLDILINGTTALTCPHDAPSEAFDAYWSGRSEAADIHREYLRFNALSTVGQIIDRAAGRGVKGV